jgi:bifunctional non-homologous end joining protein LigD
MAYAAGLPPSDPGWLFEVKWDGVRALCYLENGRVHAFSRTLNPMDRQYPEIAALAEAVDAGAAIIDGEVVALDEQGRPSFGLLQRRMHVSDASSIAHLARVLPVILYVFDLLYLDGWDLRLTAIEDRKRLLASILKPSATVKLSDHFQDQGKELYALAQQSGLEGIVAKRMGSPYESKRSPNWLKIKVTQQQEFVICGYAEGERDRFGSLVLGIYERPDAERPVYVGNVGSGFDHESLELVWKKLEPLLTSECPFGAVPSMLRPAIWARPELVCQVKYSSWTHEQRLRAPVFLGLRNDVQPRDCLLEGVQAGAPQAAFALPPPLLTDTRDKVILEVDQRRLTFTNLNKLYYPKEGYTKRDLINYYSQVADLILPHIRDRALSLRRYPDGIEGESFFQKDASEHFPDWLRVEPIYSAHNDAPIRFVVADDTASLLFLANLGCIDQNPWMSRMSSLENPDFLLIDLDPQECSYDKIIEAAQLVRQKLDLLELYGYPKTTGGDGMHVYVPLEPVYSYEQVRSFAQLISLLVISERPELFTTHRAVSRREKGRVYFDWAQIATGKTISAPYVLRAYPGAPVATPLEWREVRLGLLPEQFHLRNVLERFARVGDLFAGVIQKPQRIEKALEKLDSLVRSPK